MGLVERIKLLCDEKKTNFAEVERNIGISNGQIRRWNTSTPGTDKLEMVADYFDVSVDYLLGRTDKKRYYDLTEKDERDIERDLERILNSAESELGLASFDGRVLDEMDQEDRELYITSLRNALRLHKRLAKKKFTPKKYR
ncbi:helix-turn-helix transcriptional regulator [Lysinibacillus irui]|uniref:Helix-turn-helix transcriptional regulator n=2 Tax=Lysinibacillus TaxID=400634 RepID=A0ABU5NRK3_9BACI|nr:helix-turn-helix transcriptional regulator [Lysinibacillus irui]MEA0554619.1 helix-turn-helix transcriptional regulator [Lysinibacillus irui]MEA0978661.1 helix-turn-helix transcriptional regulator [Lysinibacillus irui]MEA1044815.1 helix-turn-helix transcriptional regulator [Lysinibacillus irui]